MPEQVVPTALPDLFSNSAPLLADDLAARVTAAVREAIDSAGDSYRFAKPYTDSFTYGTDRWRFVNSAVAVAFSEVPGVRMHTARAMRFPVIGCGEGQRPVLLYALCLANDALSPVQGARVRPTPLRKALLTAPRSGRFVQVSLEWPGSDEVGAVPAVEECDEGEADGAALEAAEVEPMLDARTVVVGYGSNPDAGLLRLIVGEARMAADGELDFAWWQELPVTEAATHPHPANGPVGGGFANAPEPSYNIGVRGEEGTGTTHRG